jgi:hypothetical protein
MGEGNVTRGQPNTYTLKAGEAITARTICYLKSDGLVYMCDDGTKPPMFIATAAVDISTRGVFESAFPSVQMVAGEAINPGATVICGTNGVAMVTDTNSVWLAGIYIGESAAAATQWIEVLHCPHISVDKSTTIAD